MAKKDERNLNITINNPEEDEDKVIISFGTLFRKLKKYFMIWLLTAVLMVGAAFGYSAVVTNVRKPALTAVISFSYSGIEKGLDPAGKKFDVYSIKNPSNIEATLTQLGMDLTYLEPVRSNITINGNLPKDVKTRLTLYDEVLNQNGSIQAAERILETSYFPTQYTVYFDYVTTGLSDGDAVELFNTLLDNYDDYFYEQYGYNESLGNSMMAISYQDYDYAEAIDVFDNNLSSMKRYIRQLSNEDSTRFRSSVTGYTFDDLYSAIDTVQSLDLDRISSYVTVNNITKDKERTVAYYEYRIKALTRQRDQYEEELEALENSIQQYEKDQIIVFGSSEDTSTQSSLASAQYDKMFGQRNDISSSLASTKQSINFYKDRLQDMKGKTTNTGKMIETVEADLDSLNTKVNELVELVCDTSEDYYKNVTLKNAYNVLVPATSVSVTVMNRIISNTKMPALFLEAIAFLVYFAVAFIQAFLSDNRKAKAEAKEDDKDDNEKNDDDSSDKETKKEPVSDDNEKDKSKKK